MKIRWTDESLKVKEKQNETGYTNYFYTRNII